MNVKEALIKWVNGPKRIYADGVRLFELLASDMLKNRYLAYFRSVSITHGNDPHFTMLLDRLSRILQQVKVSPNAFPALGASFAVSENYAPSASVPQTNSVGSQSEQSGTIVLTAKDLPKNEAGYYARIQEIFPLVGSLHAQLADESLTDNERKDIADEIVSLDSERRSLWDKIDNFLLGRPSDLKEVRPEYSDNQFVRGLQMASRIKKVKDNIGKTKGSITKFTNEGNEKALANAQARLERYERELAQLEAEVANAESESPVQETVPEG